MSLAGSVRRIGPALTTLASGAVLTLVYIYTRDVLALMIAHVATDLYGLMLAGPSGV